ncbi:MAG: GntR family transcriptional regulator [Deltaproteobacteria bacterium]
MDNFTVDTTSYIPAYRQIEAFLIDRIKAGQLKPYTRVWSERKMADRLRVSRMTARRAISNLVTDGYLFAQGGKGTFVSDRRIDLPVLQLKNFFDEMKSLGMTPTSRILSYKQFRATPQIASDLQVPPGTRIFKVRRLMSGDGVPYTVETKCVIHDKCKLLKESHGRDPELLEVMSGRCYRCVTKFDISIEPTVLNEEEVELFGLAGPVPAFCIKKYAYDAEGDRISFTKSIYRGDIYRLQATAEY